MNLQAKFGEFFYRETRELQPPSAGVVRWLTAMSCNILEAILVVMGYTEG